MNSHILKLDLENLPWTEYYSDDLLKVKPLAKKRIVDDRYADDVNYGLYTGDDVNAYYHAWEIYERLCGLRGQERSEEVLLQTAELQTVFLQDVKNYLMACTCLLIDNPKRIKVLVKMAGEVCCTERFVELVKKHWEAEQEERRNNRREDEYSVYEKTHLDFPELYTAIGDKLLYEEHNTELAIEFYQLVLLEWEEDSRDEEETEALQRRISDFKHIRDKKHYRISFQSDAPVLRELYQCFGRYFKIQKESLETVRKAVKEAEAFAELFCRVITDTFYAEDTNAEYKIKSKEDFRLCYMMALLIYNDAFLWAIFCLIQEEGVLSQADKEDIIRGLEFNTTEYLQPVQSYWLHAIRTRGSSLYQNLLLLLQETAYVELIREILREKNPKQDIAYYTSLNTLRYMLPERAKEKAGRLSIMHVAYMNDPNEGKTLWNYCGGKVLSGISNGQRRALEYPFVFLKCFTPLIDDLPMWEMYGDHAAGCCIIFQKAFLKSTRLPVPLYRVCYLRKKSTSYDFLESDNPEVQNKELLKECLTKLQELYKAHSQDKNIRPYFRKITEPIIFLFKDANYQHEQELRIMYRYAQISEDFLHIEGEYPKLYINPEIYLRIKEIILGPKVTEVPSKIPYLQEEMEKMSQLLGVKCPGISASEIEYQ